MSIHVVLGRRKAVGLVILVAQELFKSFNLPFNTLSIMLCRNGPVQPRDHAERADVPVAGGSSSGSVPYDPPPSDGHGYRSIGEHSSTVC